MGSWELGSTISACILLAVGAIYCILAVATQLMIFNVLAAVYVGLGALIGLGMVVNLLIEKWRKRRGQG